MSIQKTTLGTEAARILNRNAVVVSNLMFKHLDEVQRSDIELKWALGRWNPGDTLVVHDDGTMELDWDGELVPMWVQALNPHMGSVLGAAHQMMKALRSKPVLNAVDVDAFTKAATRVRSAQERLFGLTEQAAGADRTSVASRLADEALDKATDELHKVTSSPMRETVSEHRVAELVSQWNAARTEAHRAKEALQRQQRVDLTQSMARAKAELREAVEALGKLVGDVDMLDALTDC